MEVTGRNESIIGVIRGETVNIETLWGIFIINGRIRMTIWIPGAFFIR